MTLKLLKIQMKDIEWRAFCHTASRSTMVLLILRPNGYTTITIICTQTKAHHGAISKMYPADYCNLTEFFEFHLYLSQNYRKRKQIHMEIQKNFVMDGRTDGQTDVLVEIVMQMEIQKILSNCSSQQGTFLKLRQLCSGLCMSGSA